MKQCIFSLLILFVASCGRKNNLKDELCLLQSHPIDICLNEMEHFSSNIGETEMKNCEVFYQSPMLLVVYNDSTRCSPCMAKNMYLWEDFIGSLKNKYNGNINVCFIFSPPKGSYKDLKITLQNAGFNYPVFIDTANVFSTKNTNIPQNNRLHIFLLDKKRNVVLAGNPLYSPQIEKLLLDIADKEFNH